MISEVLSVENLGQVSSAGCWPRHKHAEGLCQVWVLKALLCDK